MNLDDEFAWLRGLTIARAKTVAITTLAQRWQVVRVSFTTLYNVGANVGQRCKGNVGKSRVY